MPTYIHAHTHINTHMHTHMHARMHTRTDKALMKQNAKAGCIKNIGAQQSSVVKQETWKPAQLKGRAHNCTAVTKSKTNCMLPLSRRPAGAAERDEHQAGGDPEVSGHVPGDKAADLPAVLLPVQRRPPGNPGPVQEPGGRAAPLEEVLRQHQVAQDEQGQWCGDCILPSLLISVKGNHSPC